MTPWRRLLVPALSTAVMLVILLGLGTWQVQRLAWKNDLLAQLARAEAAPPAPLAGNPGPFEKIRIDGQFLPGISALYAAEGRDGRAGPVMGAHLLMVLQRPDGDPVLVDRGWVPDPPPRPGASAPVSVVGYIRPAEHPGWFSPADDPKARHFYTLDPPVIAAALGVPRLAPFTLVALGPPGEPDPVRHLPRPPNDHLSYAITWYGLAIVLLVIFLLHARKVLRP